MSITKTAGWRDELACREVNDGLRDILSTAGALEKIAQGAQ
jgi:hypothetical protein